MKNKGKLLTTLCVLSVASCGTFLSNSAHAMTKDELKANLGELRANMTLTGKIVKPSEEMLKQVNDFIDKCGDLSKDQYDAIFLAANNIAASISQSEAKNFKELNADNVLKGKIMDEVEVLKGKIPGLEVSLSSACTGTIKLNGAELNVDENFLRGGKVNPTDNPTDDSTDNSTSKNATTNSSTSKSTSSSNAIKATGADIDLTAASLTAISSLFTVLGAMAIARKKKLFE